MRGNLGHFFKVEGGRDFLIQVPGISHANLNDAEVAELQLGVATFSTNEMPEDTPLFTANEVTQLRSHPLVDVIAKRLEIVSRLKARGINID